MGSGEKDALTKKDDFYRMCSTLSYVIIIFLVGVPMWWKTTEIYRVALPYDQITALNETPIISTVQVGVFIRNVERQNAVIKELETFFQTGGSYVLKFVPINVDDAVLDTLKTPARLESQILKTFKVTPGNLLMAEWSKLTEDILITSDRTIFLSETVSASKVHQVLRTLLLREHKIKSILGMIRTFDGEPLRHSVAPPSSEYEILISVLNPRPDLQQLHWNIKEATEQYLAPFLNDLKSVSNFALKSQWKYQVQLQYDSRQVKDESKLGRHYALTEDNLPHIITAVERKLGTDVTNKPCIHLVVYVPPCLGLGPLYIYDKQGQRSSNASHNSFISAKWGGVVIVNPSEHVCLEALKEETDAISQVYINSHQVMETFIYQLRKIFDLEFNAQIPSVSMLDLEQIQPRLWEKDLYVRIGCIHLIQSASSTLQSLIQLLGDIKNIVINDNVGNAVFMSYDNILLAKSHLLANDLEKSVFYARKAFEAAEVAFFDPSLLALLYFPDEQKYAIYIPLYLPILIPVLLSIMAMLKAGLKKKKVEVKDEKPKSD